ncbi:hypothetical protein UlMin_035524 [Ulmus minor]
MANCNHTPNDIENPPPTPLATLLRNELDALPPFSPMRCIYKVLPPLRYGNDRVYTPQLVSIGPIHHGKEDLKSMEYHKKMCLNVFLKRSNKSLDYYVEMIKQEEEKLRSYYAEPIEFTPDEFVNIVLVDAAFIIEVLLSQIQNQNRISDKLWMFQSVLNDLMLLENQLPLFIIEKLLDRVYGGCESESDSIILLSYKLFGNGTTIKGKEENLRRLRSSDVLHFVDFLRRLCVPLSGSGGQIDALIVPKVTELHRAGVKFKVGSSQNLFDLQFSKGVLEIPMFQIFDGTELIIRNMLAFEQYHCTENYLSDFVVMMDRLIDTPDDVGLLVKYGIIENGLGDNANVSTLINKLQDGVYNDYGNFYFDTLSKQLNDYYRTSWHKWKANLKQNYFNTPWATVSVIAAVLLIILTIIQAVCSVISL